MEKHSIKDWFNHIGVTIPADNSGWRKMRCPYHDDSHASATVNYTINRFHCFGCGVTGDTYDMIIKEKGGTLVEAIEFASTISNASDTAIRRTNRPSRTVSVNKTALGRRGETLSSGSGRRSSSGS